MSLQAPDKFAIRGYNSERDRHAKNARRALELARQRIESAMAGWERGPSPLLAADARHALHLIGEACGETEAFLALHEVRFLVETPEPDGITCSEQDLT